MSPRHNIVPSRRVDAVAPISVVADLIEPGGIIPVLRAGSRKQALQSLARRAAVLTGQPEQAIFEALIERERLGSTGIGDGVAIPHGRLPDLDRLYGLFARLDAPIEFDAVDGEPVDLVWLLLAPETSVTEHIRALARVARRLRDRTLREALRGAEGADAIHALLTAGDGEVAAG